MKLTVEGRSMCLWVLGMTEADRLRSPLHTKQRTKQIGSGACHFKTPRFQLKFIYWRHAERNYLALAFHRVILEIERMYITSLTVFPKLSVL